MPDLHHQIQELEMSLLHPEVRSSATQLNTLLADDFMEFGSSGAIYTKKDILERLPASTDTTIFTVTDFTTKMLSDDIAMTNFKTEKSINNLEKVFSLRTSLWRKEDGNWRIFFHQGTPIK